MSEGGAVMHSPSCQASAYHVGSCYHAWQHQRSALAIDHQPVGETASGCTFGRTTEIVGITEVSSNKLLQLMFFSIDLYGENKYVIMIG